MKRLEELRDVTDTVLAGLTADESLKHKILQRAAEYSDESSMRSFRPLPVLCSVITVLLVAVCLLNSLHPVTPAGSVEMNVFAAGSDDIIQPEDDSVRHNENEVIRLILPEDAVSVELSGSGVINDAQQCVSLIETLCQYAVPACSDSSEGDTSVIITFSDGSVLTFKAEEPFLIGEEQWSCPEFFRLIQQMLDN